MNNDELLNKVKLLYSLYRTNTLPDFVFKEMMDELFSNNFPIATTLENSILLETKNYKKKITESITQAANTTSKTISSNDRITYDNNISEMGLYSQELPDANTELIKNALGIQRKKLPNGTIIDGIGKIDGFIGQGGMGSVYKVSTDSGQTKAVKLLRKANASTNLLQRFINEAQIGKQFKHPNLVQTYNIKPWQNYLCIEMEYIEGENLHKLIEDNGPFLPENIGRLISGILNGLEVLHHNNYLHRDIKPSNILITKMKDPKIADFGLSKNFKATLGTGMGFIGTLDYSAPEQLRAPDKVDHRIDIYSFGACLYEIVTKQKLFYGDSKQKMMKILEEKPVRPEEFQPSISLKFSNIIMKCLKKDPSERYNNIQEIKSDFQQYYARG